ncbi:DUF2846 domain-containing protein [Riemerella columbina]|uniref:DUF2846 domain-containing protein n=1 Tax=Riemerella columbina TaxID=103810 RepID=UPI000477F1FC|nr:DUF2846 domain-containing protein [Riemerella columbina]
MNKYLKNISLFSVLGFCLSCSSTSQYVKFTPPSDSISENSSMICVIRPKSAFGAALKSKIYQDDKLIGNLGYASYLCWETQPQSTKVIATTENKDILELNLFPASKNFIRLDYTMGFAVGRAKLVPIKKSEFDQYLPQVKQPTIENK